MPPNARIAVWTHLSIIIYATELLEPQENTPKAKHVKETMLVPSIDTRWCMAYHFRGLLCLYLLITMASFENVSSMQCLM